jgi:hypothetical protein
VARVATLTPGRCRGLLPVITAVPNSVSVAVLTALAPLSRAACGPYDNVDRCFTLSGDTGVWFALLDEQWLGDLTDEPVRVGQVGVGESDAVVS